MPEDLNWRSRDVVVAARCQSTDGVLKPTDDFLANAGNVADGCGFGQFVMLV